MKGVQKRKKSVLNVFREWDRVLFPNSDSGLVSAAGHDRDANSNLRVALSMLDADEVKGEEEEIEE